jgi:hypothetical protein
MLIVTTKITHGRAKCIPRSSLDGPCHPMMLTSPTTLIAGDRGIVDAIPSFGCGWRCATAHGSMVAVATIGRATHPPL